MDWSTPPCKTSGCQWGRRICLEHFFEFYRETTASYVPDFVGEEDSALRDHADLFSIIRLLKEKGSILSLEECRSEYFYSCRGHGDGQSTVSRADQDRALELAARVLTMTSISLTGDSEDEENFQISTKRTWRCDQTLQRAIADTFPTRIHPSLQPGDAYARSVQENLTAAALMKVAGLKFERTDDLEHHLRLDQATGVVKLFHHTTFLKELLLASQRKHLNPSVKSTPSQPGLPRSLALETLYTYQLLFPQEPKCQALLRTLVAKNGFDPDVLRFGTSVLELPGEKQSVLRYPLWGSRLMDLFDELENPKPRGMLDAWLERRSKSRHVMLATIAGVITAVTLGILSLAVSIFQAWISWQEWKDPR